MRKITILLITAFMAIGLTGWSQSTTIDFETAGIGYTPSGTEGTGDIDVFNRTNPNIGGNATYIWSVEDLSLINPSITLDQIDLTGATSFTFAMDMIAHHFNDWDNNDELLITYSVDGGAYQNLMWIENTGEQYNDPAALDTDFNGDGECAYVLPALTTGTGTDGCVVSNNTFENFATSAIALSSNTTLDILLQFNGLTSGDEGIYLDNININLISGGNNPPVITSISHTPSSDITSTTTISVSADVTDSDGTIAGVELHWGTTSGSLGTTINMSYSGLGDTYTTDTNIPAQADGTTVYYEVYALDDVADDATSAEYSYIVSDPATTTLPYSETFDADLGDCYTYSVTGATKEWTYASFGANGYADINGYNSGDTEEDWLILPGIDFDSYSNEIMSFDTWWQYGVDDANNYMKLYYSADYPGIGDPSTYTWTELTYTLGATQTWTSSGIIDLSSITGTSVYIGFKYLYEAGNYRHMEVDNISIVPSVPVDVTFQVDMSDETVSGNGVHIAGSMQGWDPATTEMFDADLDGIYTVTLPLMSNVEYQFKYINGNAWGDDETVPTGCETGGNRTEVTSSPDYSIPVVCFGSCVPCGGSFFDITFQVDMQNETVSGDGVYLAGSFTDWGTFPILMTQAGTIWSTTVSLQENSPEEYKFINGDPNNGGTWEFIGNRLLTIPSANTVIDVDCFNSYDACPVSDFVIINEVDADTDGTDVLEFIELYDGGAGNTSLSGLVVVLYNGSDDQSYLPALDLDGFSTDVNGYFLLGNSGVIPTPSIIFPSNTLQNGADAVALHIGNDTDYPNDTPVSDVNLIDAIVYDTNDGDDSGLLVLLNAGEPQINEGGRGDQAAHSSQRLPNGSGGQRNTSTYDQAIPTPGAVNAASFTDWTGASTYDWFDAGSWSNGLPTSPINAVVPDMTVSGNPNPILNDPGAIVNDLVVQSLGELTIGPAGQLTVNGSLSNQNGAAGIVLQSSAAGQGSLLTNDATYMTVQTYLSQDQYHGVSAPVTGDVAGSFFNVYLSDYLESDGSWTFIVDEATPLPLGLGFFAWADNSLTGNFTADHVGVINVNDVSNNLGYTNPHPILGEEGWNIVGNPFTSAVDWNSNWTLTNLDATMYILENGNYKTMNTSGSGTLLSSEIPVGQGFWVRANATGASITIPASERLHGTQDFYKSEDTDLHFTIQGNGYSDEMVIQFNDNASSDFDSQYDAYKYRGIEAAPQLYMVQNGVDMATNILPFEDNLMVPVNLEVGADGNYSFIAEFDGIVEVTLEDLMTGEMISLNTGTEYTFSVGANDAAERFVLHFGSLTSISSIDQSTINVYSQQNDIYVSVPANTQGDIFIYNMMGQNVTSTKINGTLNKVSLNESAYYVVKVISNEQITSTKVFIK